MIDVSRAGTKLWSALRNKRVRTNVLSVVSLMLSALSMVLYGAAHHFSEVRECHDAYEADITPALWSLFHPVWRDDYPIPIFLLLYLIFCIYYMIDFVSIQAIIFAFIVIYLDVNVDLFLLYAHCGHGFHGYADEGVAVTLLLASILTAFLTFITYHVARWRAARRS